MCESMCCRIDCMDKNAGNKVGIINLNRGYCGGMVEYEIEGSWVVGRRKKVDELRR